MPKTKTIHVSVRRHRMLGKNNATVEAGETVEMEEGDSKREVRNKTYEGVAKFVDARLDEIEKDEKRRQKEK